MMTLVIGQTPCQTYSFIHCHFYSAFIESLPGTPSVRDATVNNTAAAFRELMVSLGTQIKEQAKIDRDATTGERD